jgi:hypothetical protein
MFASDDTIVAIATPAGRGALGVVRLSGPRALDFAGALLECGAALQPRYATLTRVTSAEGGAGDVQLLREFWNIDFFSIQFRQHDHGEVILKNRLADVEDIDGFIGKHGANRGNNSDAILAKHGNDGFHPVFSCG